jgi:hypothetical protein
MQPLHSSQPCVMIHIRHSPCHPWQCRCCVAQDIPAVAAALVSFVSQCFQRTPTTCRRCLRLSRHRWLMQPPPHRLLMRPLHSPQPCMTDPQRMPTVTCIRCLRSFVSHAAYSRLTGCSCHVAALLQPLHSSQSCVIHPQRMPTDLHTLSTSHSSHLRFIQPPPYRLLLQPLHSSQPCVMIHIHNSPCHPAMPLLCYAGHP